MNYQTTNYYVSLSDRDKNIIDDYVNGVSTKQMIDKYKITKQRISQIVSKFSFKTNIDIKRKSPKWYAIDEETNQTFVFSNILKKHNLSIYSYARKEAVKNKRFCIGNKRYTLVYK